MKGVYPMSSRLRLLGGQEAGTLSFEAFNWPDYLKDDPGAM